MKEEELLGKIKENVIQGRKEKDDEGFDDGFEGQPAVKELTEQALSEGVNPKTLVNALTEAMRIVGEKFATKEYLIPDMLASAKTVALAMNILTPYLEKAGVEKKGKILMATVKGDIHDIGKNIVIIVLKGAGFEVKDLGTGVPEEDIARMVREESPQVLGLSALLTSTMQEMRVVIEKLKEEGLRDPLKVIVGGAPLSEEYAKDVGADGYAPDAFGAQKLVERMIQG